MKPTVLELRGKKGARLAMLTAYDFPSARLVAEAGIELILVGDSLGMVVLGYGSTLPVTMDDIVPIVEALARAGVPVLGHVGLTPQTASALGGYKLQGKDEENARRIMEGAQALERAGCWGVVLELVPSPLARLVTESIGIPTIGIGAGAHCDGQVLVFHDLVGLFAGFTPSFVKRYAEAGAAIKDAVARYAAEVRNGSFPAEGQSFGMKEEVLKRLHGR